MSDTIDIPVKLLDDLVKVNEKLVDINNRLKACNRRSVIEATDTSQKEGKDTPEPPSKKTILINKTRKYLDKIKA